MTAASVTAFEADFISAQATFLQPMDKDMEPDVRHGHMMG
jgi:hypothetical protein